jgi:hypothetical protein
LWGNSGLKLEEMRMYCQRLGDNPFFTEFYDIFRRPKDGESHGFTPAFV